MPTPIVPPQVNSWLNSPQSRNVTTQYPLNLCGVLDVPVQANILRYINERYVWPQIQERMPYETMWDAILDMYRIALRKVDVPLEEASQAGRDLKEKVGDRLPVADSVVHDAIERLTDITHFVSFKEGLPCQYNVPKYFDNRNADQFYDPLRGRMDSMNALLQWNFESEDIYRKYIQTARHFYQYGCAFAVSEFVFETEPVQSIGPNGQPVVTSQFKKLGTTYEPISIRKIWLNYRLGIHQMEYQPCPFFIDEVPRWSVVDQPYDPNMNPFGFLNLDLMPQDGQGDWMYSGNETTSLRNALDSYLAQITPGSANAGGQSAAMLLRPENSVELKWTYYPMLPLDDQSGDWLTYGEGHPMAGKPVPMKRYIVTAYGANCVGKQTLLRVQRNFYPRDQVPIYGSAHMPDLDSGLYTPSLGFLLWNHYRQLVTCMQQYISNKDWINNPPAWVNVSSPAANEDFNKPGAKIKVLGQHDFGWKQPYDATGSTAAVMQLLREAAKQTSKSTDALMGQAMGSRTSATEASNAFQASMSAVTTPINLLNHDMMGGYAQRMWDYAAAWMPPEILKTLTGMMGLSVTSQDLLLRPAVQTDSGSTYIESIVRQQNIQYVLQTGVNDPTLNRAAFWKMLLREMKFPNAEELVNDGGFEREVQIATEQAIQCFLGQPVPISPDQNHSIAIQVKTRFLEDRSSEYMTKYIQNAPLLFVQIQQHQQILQLQLMQQAAHAQAGLPLPGQPGAVPMVGGAQPPGPPNLIENPGDMMQQQG